MVRHSQKIMIGKYVLVTTLHKGIFAGILTAKDGKNSCTLEQARNCIRFGTTDGFLELADKGPNSNSKIGSVATEIELWDLTSYAVCTDAARKAWEAA